MSSTTVKPRVALFDLDHTLIPMDSDFGWGNFTVDLGWVDGERFSRANEMFYAQYKNGTLNIHDYIAFATKAICKRTPQECLVARRRYLDSVIAGVVTPQALSLVRGHLSGGDTVAMVTATNDFVTSPIAPMFGIGHLIAVNLEVDQVTGWYSGKITGVPSFREGKVTRVRQWLESLGWDINDVETTFYSDSINDLPLMEAVDHPVATNPDNALLAIAKKRGWKVLNLFAGAAPVTD